MRYLLILSTLAVLVLGVLVVGGVLDPEESHDIQGTLLITGGLDAGYCFAEEGRPTILELVLKDEHGRFLGRSHVKPGRYPMHYGCRLPYTIEDVPTVGIYNFSLTANPDGVLASYPLAQMQARGWRVDFDLPIR